MENISLFREPKALDVLKGALIPTLQYGSDPQVNFASICVLEEIESLPLGYGFLETVKKYLAYGFRLLSEKAELIEIKIGQRSLGKRDAVIVESLHGKSFLVFEYSCYIGIIEQ